MQAFNAAADWLAGEAFRLRTDNKVELQQLYYRRLRDDFGLSAQMAIRCIAQVCEAYSRDKSKRPRFRKYASIPYDQRLMSFKGVDRVSLLTLEGRTIVPVIMGDYQSERFNGKHGQCDLHRRKDGKWFLLVSVEAPDVAPTPTTDFIGTVKFGPSWSQRWAWLQEISKIRRFATGPYSDNVRFLTATITEACLRRIGC